MKSINLVRLGLAMEEFNRRGGYLRQDAEVERDTRAILGIIAEDVAAVEVSFVSLGNPSRERYLMACERELSSLPTIGGR